MHWTDGSRLMMLTSLPVEVSVAQVGNFAAWVVLLPSPRADARCYSDGVCSRQGSFWQQNTRQVARH